MAKKRFSTSEAVAIWMAYEGICTLCERPLPDLRSLTIDHIIPEHLLGHPDKLKAVKSEYKLKADFNINDFSNWVPAHPKCNQRKGTMLFEGPAAMCSILARANRIGAKARRIHAKLTKRRDFAELIGQLDHHFGSAAPSVEEMALLRTIVLKAEEEAPLEAKLLVDPKRWRVLHIKPWGLAEVTDGTATGHTPIRGSIMTFEDRWKCEKCGEFGPFYLDHKKWINTCLNCGNVE